MPGLKVARSYKFYRWESAHLQRNKIITEASFGAEQARQDFLAFRWYVCGHRSYLHHVAWAAKLNTEVDSACLVDIAGPNTLLLAPRGSAKSTFLTEWVAFQIGRQTRPGVQFPIKILYTSYNTDVAVEKSIEVKRIIQSPQYREVFPWVRPSKRWSDKIWEIDKASAGLPLTGEAYTLCCAGLTGSVNSKRASLIVLDDLIKSPQQIKNPSIRSEMEYNWTSVISKTMFEGARAVCLGTRMSGDDIYCTTFTPERKWSVIEESALIDRDGEEVSYWPPVTAKNKMGRLETVGWSTKFFQEEREDDPMAFAFQRQNKIASSATVKLSKDWIKDAFPPMAFEELAIGLDLASSLKQTADFTAFVLVGKTRDDKYYVLDMKRGKWAGNIDKCEVLIQLCLEWGILETENQFETDGSGRITWFNTEGDRQLEDGEVPTFTETGVYVRLFCEAESYQVSFKSDFTREIQNKYNIWNIQAVPKVLKGDKLQKLRGVSGPFQAGKVWFNKSRNLKVLKTEITEFAQKDDGQDALVLALEGLGARTRLSMG